MKYKIGPLTIESSDRPSDSVEIQLRFCIARELGLTGMYRGPLPGCDDGGIRVRKHHPRHKELAWREGN
jgi:hypothetical protein